jgi:outer membrane receptor protein involved in Fe transport
VPGLTASSPVASTSEEKIKLQSAMTIEDFSTKLPQLSGGVRQGSQGSDAFGAQVLELRNFGQSRSLVLIDGTRAAPFSFRNSVDVNAMPASLIKRVDVLTGGAAAVYGADAVAGVVNFILNDDFEGLQATTAARLATHGGAQYGGSLMLGAGLGDRGHLVIAADYTQRDGITASQRSWANTPGQTIPSIGGVFTDVASGRKFGFTDAGAFTTTPSATSNISGSYPLTSPLKRINAAALFKYEITPQVEIYGRAMFTNAHRGDRHAGRRACRGQPDGLDQPEQPFLTDAIRNQLTFVNGTAQVNVSRSLAELGLVNYDTERNTLQVQGGLRGPLTPRSSGTSMPSMAVRREHADYRRWSGHQCGGANNFASIVNTVNIFGPNQSSGRRAGQLDQRLQPQARPVRHRRHDQRFAGRCSRCPPGRSASRWAWNTAENATIGRTARCSAATPIARACRPPTRRVRRGNSMAKC